MFTVYWKAKRGRYHKTTYTDPFAAVRGFRSHKVATLVRDGVALAMTPARHNAPLMDAAIPDSEKLRHFTPGYPHKFKYWLKVEGKYTSFMKRG